MTDVSDPSFWRERLLNAMVRGEPWKSVWDIDKDTWDRTNATHKETLRKIIPEGSRVLDAGCGLGTLAGLLPPCRYTGVDISPDLIACARVAYPGHRFDVEDLRSLPYAGRSFDFAVCRSVEGMITTNLGTGVWRLMQEEILRVADRLVLLGYSFPEGVHITDAVANPLEFRRNEIAVPGVAHLTYRPGQDGTCEIYDIEVEEGQRGRGVGRDLITRLEMEGYHTLYALTRDSNVKAQRFYLACGFVEIARVPGFYRSSGAVLFSREVRRHKGDSLL